MEPLVRMEYNHFLLCFQVSDTLFEALIEKKLLFVDTFGAVFTPEEIVERLNSGHLKDSAVFKLLSISEVIEEENTTVSSAIRRKEKLLSFLEERGLLKE